MNCPKCQSNQIRKNGHRRDKQNYQCKNCGRQFLDFYSTKGYSSTIKEECLKMYVNGLGFRAIERVKGVNHNTVIRWVKQVANLIPEPPENYEIPEVGEIDELQTFVGKKKIKSGCGLWLTTNVQTFQSGIQEIEVQKHLNNYGIKLNIGNAFFG